ncbi:ribonuclease H [Trifolium repens]|nr:ribonuclease H [Trifolium repens]
MSFSNHTVFYGRNRKPGIYLHWPECKEQVDRFSSNGYHSYKSYKEATTEWINHYKRKGFDDEYVQKGIPTSMKMETEIFHGGGVPNCVVRGFADSGTGCR